MRKLLLTVTTNPALDLFAGAQQVRPTHKIRCGAPLVHPGGGGINVARVLARMGADVLAVYLAGGVVGERLTGLLREEGVPVLPLAIAGETRESLTVHEASTGLDYRFVLPGPVLAASEWQACLQETVNRAAESRLVVASGSLPPGAPEDWYARLARLLATHRVRLAIDSSGPALAQALEAGVYLVKPSLRELGEYVSAALDTREQRLAACRRLIDAGQAQVVALSLGSEGALLVTADGAWHAGALAVQVASTIGAGDSFLAGLVAALAQGADPDEALAQGIAASAAALLTSGTALCRPEDVQRLLPQVRVTRW